MKVTNTLTAQKEQFIPLDVKTVRMYNCGPTVYNYAHLGNLRSYVFADLLKRALKYEAYDVIQVINITDVGHLVGDSDVGRDKVEEGARKENKTAREITEYYAQAFLQDLADLNIDTDGTLFPRATEHINEQIALISKLESLHYTYKTSDGIYFDSQKFKSYGKLGNVDVSHLKEGARVMINSEKKHLTDFALWKFSQPHEKRQQEWESPWGIGFPGWHIECSAMAMKYLGETFDIHTGGIDHIPVHHNNEIAQAECATGKKYVNYWLHNEFVNVDGGKMAKSEGNFLRLESLREKNINPLAYRYWLLMAHYKVPVLFSWEALEAADNALNKLVSHFNKLDAGEVVNEDYARAFYAYIADDLDTPNALALIWKMLKDRNVTSAEKRASIAVFDEILGLNIVELAKQEKKSAKPVPPVVYTLIKERTAAKEAKEWATADTLREKIKSYGFDVVDTSEGTKVKPLSTS